MGFALVGTYNTSTTSGALTFYGDYFAKAGYISFVFSGSPPAVAPYGTTQPLFGTNPICIGVPSSDEPIVLDMATSAMAWYGLVESKTEKKQVSIDIGFDVDGNPTTDPGKILEGAIRPFDQSHKSGGLNLMVEILTGPLVTASFASFGDVDNWGNLILVFDPKLMTEDLSTDVTRLVQKVKSLRREKKDQEVFVPGERGGKVMKKALEMGTCEIEENLYYALLKAAGMSSKL
jgi:L-2-hydroxycarboxylate dehydrogenase (NAD+)